MDWQDAIHIRTDLNWSDLFGWGRRSSVDRDTPDGSVFFKRRKGRKFRTRYIVLRSGAHGRLQITNAEVRYRKSRKAWCVFVDDEPVRHYRTLKAAKLALMPGVLDRMGAEGDRCLDLPYCGPSSKSEA